MTAISRLRRLSLWLKHLTLLALVFLPFAVIVWWVSLWIEPGLMASLFPDLPNDTTFWRGKVAMAATVAILPVVPAVYALWHMRKLFGRYLDGQVLTIDAALHIRQIGLSSIAIAGLGAVLPTLLALILTADNPAGQKVLLVSLSSDSLGFLLAGGLLTVIGWAMTEAARAAEENAGFI